MLLHLLVLHLLLLHLLLHLLYLLVVLHLVVLHLVLHSHRLCAHPLRACCRGGLSMLQGIEILYHDPLGVVAGQRPSAGLRELRLFVLLVDKLHITQFLFDNLFVSL